jgi:predicted Zn-dependent protease
MEMTAIGQHSAAFRRRGIIIAGVMAILFFHCLPIQAQVAPNGPAPEAELQTGTDLTHKGLFREAIPHLLAARGRVSNGYAANFNLALCYLATKNPKEAIPILNDLRSEGHDNADVGNLLAQAYVGNEQPQEAVAALQRAALLAPENEKLYVFVSDACRDHGDSRLGLKVIDIGLKNLPQSARLHYERALYLTQLDELHRAKPEFERASKFAQGSEIGYLATAHEALSEGKIEEAIRVARAGIQEGFDSHGLLTILGEALLRSGITLGQPEFVEAQSVLEKTVAGHPDDPESQIALGSVFLIAGRLEDAISHLEKARQLDPGKPAIYSNLAKAYQRHGDLERAQGALAMLQKLNRDEVERISSAPGDQKLGYSGVADEGATPHP